MSLNADATSGDAATRGSTWRVLALMLACGVGLLGGAVLVARGMADASAGTAVLSAAVICYLAALVAILPVAIVAPRHPDWIMQAGMAAMTIRLMLTLAGGGLYLRTYGPPRWTFMTAGVVCYLILLTLETVITLRLVNKHWKPAAGR